MSDWTKSDHCTECGGNGYLYLNGYSEELGQCEECERLHELEVRADIAQDVAKGN